jgi:hypothetical protein
MNVDAFFQQDSFQERVLVPQHEAFICGSPVTLLQALQGLFMVLDRCFEMLDILRPPLSESCLSLAVPLLAFLGSGIYWFPSAFSLLRSWVLGRREVLKFWLRRRRR